MTRRHADMSALHTIRWMKKPHFCSLRARAPYFEYEFSFSGGKIDLEPQVVKLRITTIFSTRVRRSPEEGPQTKMHKSSIIPMP